MTAQIIPPDAAPAPRPPREPGRGSAAVVIALLTAALGVAVAIGVAVSAAVPMLVMSSSRSEERALAVGGVSALSIDAHAAALTVVFDDVPEASLDVRDVAGASWTFERAGSTLRVATPSASAFRWFGAATARATLTLPADLTGIDARVDVGGGTIDLIGDFGALGLSLDAGEATARGTASTVTADIDAGRGDLDLSNVSSADLTLDAGILVARLGGTAPDAVTAAVSAGSLQLTLPDEAYDVTADASAGDVDNRLTTAPTAPRTVYVQVSAGSALLTAD